MKNRYKNYITENPFPLKIIGVIKGGYALEKKIHKQLEIWRHRGEWFIYNNVVKVEIKDIIKKNANNDEVEEKPKRRRRRKRKAITLKVKTPKVACKKITKVLS